MSISQILKKYAFEKPAPCYFAYIDCDACPASLKHSFRLVDLAMNLQLVQKFSLQCMIFEQPAHKYKETQHASKSCRFSPHPAKEKKPPTTEQNIAKACWQEKHLPTNALAKTWESRPFPFGACLNPFPAIRLFLGWLLRSSLLLTHTVFRALEEVGECAWFSLEDCAKSRLLNCTVVTLKKGKGLSTRNPWTGSLISVGCSFPSFVLSFPPPPTLENKRLLAQGFFLRQVDRLWLFTASAFLFHCYFRTWFILNNRLDPSSLRFCS